MPSTGLRALLAGSLLLVAASALNAQSLGDVAKKEEERRKATAPSTKVYTNKDLSAVPGPPDAGAKEGDKPTAADTDPSNKSEKAKEGDKAGAEKASDKAADKTAADKGSAKDRKYWKDRMDAAQLALDRDTGYLDAMQTRINALTTDFVNRDDPAQRGIIERDRQRAIAELERLRKQIADDRKAISDIEEEARRSGVPPGWLR